MSAGRVTGWAAAHAVAVTGLVLLFGHAVPGPYGLVGSAVLGAVAAALWATGLRSPATAVLLAQAGAVVVEIVLPGPDVARLGAERVTAGIAVLERHVAVWPLVLLLMLLAGGVEYTRSAGRWSWGRSLVAAAGSGVIVGALVLVAGAEQGWAEVAPYRLSYGLPGLVVLGAVVATTLLRGHLVTPAVVSGLALVVAVVASWVLPIGDPVAGLMASSTLWLTAALPVALVEVVGRALVRRVLGSPAPA